MQQALVSRWHSVIEVRMPRSLFIERRSTSVKVFSKMTRCSGTFVQEESWPLGCHRVVASRRLCLRDCPVHHTSNDQNQVFQWRNNCDV